VPAHDSPLTVRDGRLWFAGQDLAALGARLPTPFFLFSGARIAHNCETVRTAFTRRHAATEVFFASKACSALWVLDTVRAAGLGAEVNSGGELWKALRAGFAPDRIVFNGVAKTRAELERAAAAGIRAVVVDSPGELERLDAVGRELGVRARIALRVDVRVPTDTHPGMQTAHGGKFGVDLADAPALVARARALDGVDVRGLHLHVGSQIVSVEPYRRAVERALDLVERVDRDGSGAEALEFVDVGGGFPVPYVDSEAERAPGGYFRVTTTPDDYAAVVCEVLARRRPGLRLFVEPGRFIVSDAAVAVTRVEMAKTKRLLDDAGETVGEERWLLLDCGYDTLLDHTFVEWYFRAVVAGRAAEPADTAFRLGGPLCDSGDVYRGDDGSPYRYLPAATATGDVVVLRDAGAYTLDTMTQYNGRPRAGAYAVDDGRLVCFRRPESYEELVSHDEWPPAAV
jgi:diaminopimelate decarboxylase